MTLVISTCHCVACSLPRNRSRQVMLSNNYIDEAGQKNGPGDQNWEPNKKAKIDKTSDKADSRHTMHWCQI